MKSVEVVSGEWSIAITKSHLTLSHVGPLGTSIQVPMEHWEAMSAEVARIAVSLASEEQLEMFSEALFRAAQIKYEVTARFREVTGK